MTEPDPEVARLDAELRAIQQAHSTLREALHYGAMAAFKLSTLPPGDLHRRCDEFLRDLRLALDQTSADEDTATRRVQQAWHEHQTRLAGKV